MYRYKAVVTYDGSNYGGWQKQINTHSIQEEIEQALYRMHGYEVSVCASGRTDALVHALGQVFHFDSDKDLASTNWTRALNSLLPKDIRILEVCQVHREFHARFDAARKRYDYFVTQDITNPFLENYMAKEAMELDVAYMQECAMVFVGTHDFTSFTSSKIDPRKPRVKTIERLVVVKEENAVHMTFVGTGFLRYMVRMLAQTLIEAGKHRICKEDVQMMLEARDKHACRYKGAAQGLYLVNVEYKNNENLEEV